jgi:type II secretory pathway component PulM
MMRPATRAPTPLKQILSDGLTRWQALSLRERMLIGLVGLALFGAIFDYLALQPMQRQRRALMQIITSAETLLAESGTSPAAGGDVETRVAQAQRELAEVDERLAEIRSAVTPPAQMAERLRTLIASVGDLKVIALHNLPAQSVGGEAPTTAPTTTTTTTPSGTAAVATADGLYRFPIEIRLTGRYADIVAWLARLEAADDGLHVTTVALESRATGTIEARVSLYTLGTEPVWLTL